MKRLIVSLVILVGFVVVVFIVGAHQEDQQDKWFDSLPPSEHLLNAKKLFAANQTDEAIRHLQAIPSTAPEVDEAVRLLVDAKTQKLQQEAAVRQRQVEKERDSDLSSYWPTTVRVQTDMNSFWLDQEERVCVSHPDEKGRVVGVHCDSSEHSDSHNIPVTFWGSVERGKPTDWKCRKESEKFVCRAID